MGDIFREEARRLCKNGAITQEEAEVLLNAHKRRDRYIEDAIKESEEAQQDLIAEYAESKMYSNIRRISNNIVFFFWMSIVSLIIWLITLIY